MSDKATVKELVKLLQGKDLAKAMAHKHWAEAYAAILENQEEQCEGLSEVNADAAFVHVLGCVRFFVIDGKLYAEDLDFGTDPYAWDPKVGAWDNNEPFGDDDEEPV